MCPRPFSPLAHTCSAFVAETEPSVWVDAGVKVIDLLEYLGHYTTELAPAGYTLPAFPWCVSPAVLAWVCGRV